MTRSTHNNWLRRRFAFPVDERGVAVIVVVMFCMIFMILGLALYWIVASQTRSAETERSDVKSFNVAEAGVDAGMLALQLKWPTESGDTIDEAEIAEWLRLTLQEGNETLWDPSRADAAEFIQVEIYDNSVEDGPNNFVTVTTPPEEGLRLGYDAPVYVDGCIEPKPDGVMYVDATSDVDDDRRRILILAERQKLDLLFPTKLALFADAVDSNGQGFGIEIEDGTPPVSYDVHDVRGKGIDPGAGVQQLPSFTTFESVFSESLRRVVLAMALKKGTYFTDAEAAEDFLVSGQAAGAIVYIDSETSVDIASSIQIGTVEKPVAVVIDTPDGSDNVWDMRGTADLYGILVTIGDSTLRGTCSVHGAMYCSGELLNKGTGSTAELNYNEKVLINLSREQIISVNIVPNSWEEYALPTQAASVP